MNNPELLARFLVQGWRRNSNRGGPIFVTMFVTSRCNSACGHCFYLDTMNERKGRGELTLEEYRQTSRSMPPFTKMLISGGEPFLRRDLPQICEAFYRNNGVAQFTIPTNATLPDRTAEGTDWLASRAPRAFIQIQISIDATGENHDRLRKTKGNFKKLIETHSRLREVQRKHDNVDIIFNYTLHRHSRPYLRDVCTFLRDELQTRQLHMNMVRGSPHDPETLEVTPEEHREAVETLAEFFGDGVGRQDWQSRVFGRLFAARKTLTMGRINREAGFQEKPPYTPCKAGLLNLVLQEQGDVYACELIDRRLGNLRDVGFDFSRIWDGEELACFRRDILSDRCACTHETNVSTNFYFTPASYVRLARQLLGPRRMKPSDHKDNTPVGAVSVEGSGLT